MLGALIGAAASIGSSILGAKQQQKQAEQNINLQKEFAQSGIQWKVKDALKAGVHPLFALGANTHSFSPVSVGDTSGGFARAGQDIGRAVDSTLSKSGQTGAFAKAQLESMQLDNELKRAELGSKIATIRQTASPGIPAANTRWLVEGQGDTPSIDKPNIKVETRRDAAEPGAEHAVAGAGPDVSFSKTPFGGYAPVIPPALAESYEQDWIGYYQWLYRNRLAPAFGAGAPPGAGPLPPGGHWTYNPWIGEWYPRRSKWEKGGVE